MVRNRLLISGSNTSSRQRGFARVLRELHPILREISCMDTIVFPNTLWQLRPAARCLLGEVLVCVGWFDTEEWRIKTGGEHGETWGRRVTESVMNRDRRAEEWEAKKNIQYYFLCCVLTQTSCVRWLLLSHLKTTNYSGLLTVTSCATTLTVTFHKLKNKTKISNNPISYSTDRIQSGVWNKHQIPNIPKIKNLK